MSDEADKLDSVLAESEPASPPRALTDKELARRCRGGLKRIEKANAAVRKHFDAFEKSLWNAVDAYAESGTYFADLKQRQGISWDALSVELTESKSAADTMRTAANVAEIKLQIESQFGRYDESETRTLPAMRALGPWASKVARRLREGESYDDVVAELPPPSPATGTNAGVPRKRKAAEDEPNEMDGASNPRAPLTQAALDKLAAEVSDAADAATLTGGLDVDSFAARLRLVAARLAPTQPITDVDADEADAHDVH